ncbi:MAG: HAD family hydrolase [Candidatus Saccharibacteria bacterium]
MIKFIIFDFYGVLYFTNKDELNPDILKFMDNNNKKYNFGVISAIQSDLAGWLKEKNAQKNFKFIKTTGELGLPKSDPGLYQMVLASYKLKPSEVLLVDDSAENLSAAKQAGLLTLRYTQFRSIEEQIKNL